MITIRNEEERDYKVVEEITRKAFYNLYIPGCAEHYLVHIMRGHEAVSYTHLDVYKRQGGRRGDR